MSKEKKSKEKKKEKKRLRKIEKEFDKEYAQTWGTPVGQDCIFLNKTLAGWLGERLVFFAEYNNRQPFQYESYESWQDDLRKHGQALLNYYKLVDESGFGPDTDGVKQALEYVAQNFSDLNE